MTLPSLNEGERRTGVAVVVHPDVLKRSPLSFQPSKRVGSLPWLERLLLTLLRAGSHRFVLVGYSLEPALERRLQKEPRLAGRVDIRKAEPNGSTEDWLRDLAEEIGSAFLLVSGNQVFSASVVDYLCQYANEHRERPVTLLDPEAGNESAVLASVRPGLQVSAKSSADDWLSRLEQSGQVERIQPPREGYWQALTSPPAWKTAEARINRSLFKPTDNFLARLNRRVSIPISRLLVPLGVGPNAVTLVTLAFSFTSGWAFAQGSYGWTVLGGFLAWFASMLDGSDGEVARLTYQESDFGCWLESTCDHLFYLVVFAGMAIGLYRSTNEFVYLYTGGLFELGALLSFWVLSYQRKKTTEPGTASAYVVRWRAYLEAHRSNFFYRFALRYGELTRRSTLPYAIFFFALLGDMNFVLFMSTFGANLVWVLSLYSNRVLRSAPLEASDTD